MTGRFCWCAAKNRFSIIHTKSKGKIQVKTIGNNKFFGFFTGMPYGHGLCDETFSDYPIVETEYEKSKIVEHISSIFPAVTSEPTYSLIDGTALQAGMYEDGQYCFPTDFLYYHSAGLVGFPAEYISDLRSRGIL